MQTLPEMNQWKVQFINRIYHVKGSRVHAQVRLKPEEGDVCFQNVVEAELAGFRTPRYATKE